MRCRVRDPGWCRDGFRVGGCLTEILAGADRSLGDIRDEQTQYVRRRIKSTEGVFNDYEAVDQRSGKGLLWFKQLQLGGQECHSEGDAAGNSLGPVDYHLVPIPTQQDYYVVFSIKETAILCKFFSTRLTFEKGSTIMGKIAAKAATERNFTLDVNVIDKKAIHRIRRRSR